ncbi:MAG: SUMF1/EgtB/PvdO family nonheme iron enzyme [Blastocatellia bacterium]
MKKTVFISYSTKDIEIAKKVKAKLEEHGIEVTIDRESLSPGGNILDFIDQSIRETQITLSIVSPNSLASDWVAFESVQSFAAAKYVDQKEFIACYIDDAFLKDPHFHSKALEAINEQIEQIRAEIREVERQGKEFPINLTTKIQRKLKLKDNLDVILHRLQEYLTLDIREPEFDISMSRIIEKILGQPVDPTDEFREKYLRAFDQRSKNDLHQLDERFVQLTLMTDKGESETQRWDRQALQSIADIIQLNQAKHPVMVILGAPGSGKSTILRRLALDYHRAEIGAGGNRLSFFAPLNRYAFESLERRVTPQEFLESEWKTAYEDTGRSLESLLKEGRLLLLLDAINEIKHSGQKEYGQLINLWRTFAIDQQKRGNRIIFSCRSLDYSQPLSSEEMRVPNVEVQPLSPEKVGEFLQFYLPKRDREVLEQIKRNGTLDFYNNPYFLSLLCGLVGESGDIPKGRASLFTGYVRAAIKREMNSELFTKESWLSDFDCRKLSQNKWANAYQLPVAGALPERLSHLAYEMQRSGQRRENKQVSIGLEQARGLIGSERPDKMIEGGVAISVLDLDIATEEVKYHHQLLQEYFAGRRLAGEPKAELVRVEWRASEVRPSLAETIAGLANGDPLPPPGQTGWEETTLAALPMSANPEGYVEQLMEQNLPLAARCAVSPEVKISEEIKKRIREGLIARTQEGKADLRARIAAGEALGLIGDPRFELHRSSRGECLLPPLAKIASGRYPIGDDQSGIDRERPAHPVELPAFQIGVFPVTNREYAKFLDAGGYQDERWWDTPAALGWLRDGGSEGQKQAVRDARLNWQRNWTDEQIRAMVRENRATEQQVEIYLWIRNSSDEDFERQLEAEIPAGTLYRQPGFWEDATYNNPAQPVVGVSWYEARAYCNWLSWVTGDVYRLPSEVEFEAAARGMEGRRFSYGNEFDPARCNTFESHLRRPTPVGIFDNWTPEGACDLTGNVWSWTSTIFDEERFSYPWQPDQRENPGDAGSRRLVRGGSWDFGQDVARAAYRNYVRPAYRDLNFGCRVVGGLRPPSLNL